MPDSQIPCPPLIDILSYLGVARDAFFRNPTSEEDAQAATLIESAARHADRENKPFTMEFVSDWLVRLGLRDEVCQRVRSLTDGADGLESFGELVLLIDWISNRLNRLGLPLDQIEATIKRGAQGQPLDEVYGKTSCSLNHVAAELRRLDCDGTGRRIWHRVLRRSSILRNAFSEASPPSGAQDRLAAKRTVVAANLVGGAEAVLPTLDKNDELILRALEKRFPRRRSLEELESDSCVSKKTIGLRLRELIKAGWAEKRKGPKKGAALTDAGRDLLKRLDQIDGKSTP